jgi:hypothetical protein
MDLVTPHDAARILGRIAATAALVCDGEHLPRDTAIDAVIHRAIQRVEIVEPAGVRVLALVGF